MTENAKNPPDPPAKIDHIGGFLHVKYNKYLKEVN